MRKANKEIRDQSVIVHLLRTCHVGRLATNGRDGWPMVKPVNFAHENGRIYIHSALEGEKIDDIRRDSRVCFETDLPIAFVRAGTQPCEAEYLYRSVIVKGRASLVSDEAERAAAFKGLMDKYQPEGGYGAYLPGKLARTGIIRIDIEEMTGKEDLGKEGLRAQVLEALEKGAPLPIVL
ncbi:MAG: pyridoxamine 5'-phosphate oxidase family protein [Nitrospirae bacterium]|nr:pyridoxamine 5'-phosphate oxidase family protein [Nitrospirota bacterium]NTW68105.1 pyridoxamine 5'-phosphate oxidase family protein [Nitrospirota bacterium]